jgi:hypothetical protein
MNVIHHIILLFRKGHGMQIRSVTDNSLIKKKKKKIIIPKSQIKVEKKKNKFNHRFGETIRKKDFYFILCCSCLFFKQNPLIETNYTYFLEQLDQLTGGGSLTLRTGLLSKKLAGRSSNPLLIVGITGKSSWYGTW